MSFTVLSLLRRNLRRDRAANLALAAGVAVATAVLTGALLVGDSVRGSLRELALQRLTGVDHALQAPAFVPESLADRIAAAGGFTKDFQRVIPAVLLRGGAADATETRHLSGVQIGALGGAALPVPPDECIINAALADALAAREGDTLLLRVEAGLPLPQEAILARRGRGDRVATLRVRVRQVASEPGAARDLTLELTQRPPPKAWVNLAQLQQALDRPGHVNTLLAWARPHARDAAAAGDLQRLLGDVAELGDYGLKLQPAGQGETALNARSTYLAPPVEAAAHRAAIAAGLDRAPRKVFIHLLQRVEVLPAAGANGAPTTIMPARAIHYVVAAGVSDLPEGPLGEGELALNAWAARRLDAQNGDDLALHAYHRRPDGTMDIARLPGRFRLGRVLPMDGLGAEPTLTPEYPGLTDADSIASWRSPEELRIDQSLVTPEDERYWDEYRAAPKVFLSLEQARAFWAGPGAELTSLRIPTERAEAFGRHLEAQLDPALLGLRWEPVRQQQLSAAAGSTDFAGLFVGLSFFLILAAAMLTALLMRLAVEQRARPLGMLLALGWTPGRLRRLALAEAMLVAAAGGLAGLGAALGYTELMMWGLRTWWRGAVGTTALRLHVAPATLPAGLAASLLVCLAAVTWGVWRLGRARAVTLLNGSWDDPHGPGAPCRRRGIVPVAAAAGALTALSAAAFAVALAGAIEAQWGFLAGAALLLAASLTWAAWMLRPGRGGRVGLLRLAWRNAARHRARSVLTMGLLACATFLLVLTGAFRQGPPADTHQRASGAGGFTLFVQTDIPLPVAPDTPAARRLLGFLRPDGPEYEDVAFAALPRRAGQDVSCLNLNRPSDPAILSVPDAADWAGRFSFARLDGPARAVGHNPWLALDTDLPDDAVPVIADDEAARYILHLEPGQSLTVPDESGQTRTLRLVGTLRGSIFQGELLMGPRHFRRLFPSAQGFSVLLAQAPPERLGALQAVLVEELTDYAVRAEPTRDRLGRYMEVANTYLATFQTLGALGLMLGAGGLAVVMLRNLLERRAEMALLAALGFAPRRRLALVLVETCLLLASALALGMCVALAGVLPAGRGGMHLAGAAGGVAWTLAAGLGVLVLTALLRGRHVRPGDLRAE